MVVPMKPSVARSRGLRSNGDLARDFRFLDRHRLARQRGLRDEEILRAHEPHVGRNHVAGREVHDVAGHEILERHLATHPGCDVRLAVWDLARDGRGGRHHRAQGCSGARRSILLQEPHRHADDDHAGDDDGAFDVAGLVGNDAERDQYEDERVPEVADEQRVPRGEALARDLVRAELLPACANRLGRETTDRGAERGHDELGWRSRGAQQRFERSGGHGGGG
jgi:hypothetical protein